MAVAPLGLLLLVFPGHTERTYVVRTTASPRITISNLNGHVTIRGWDKAQVHAVCSTVSSRILIEVEPLKTDTPTDKVSFSTRILDTLLPENQETADYVIDVPVNSSVEIRDRQGRVEIHKLGGDAWVDSAGASISATDVGGHLSLNSVGGNIEITRASGRVEASTIFGNVHIVSPSSSKLRALSNSGKIIYEGDFLPGGNYVLSDYSGEMQILCPPTASFELNAKSVKGKVISDPALAITRRHSSGDAPAGARSFVGSTNSGDAMVELTSFSGNIRIEHQH